MRHPSPHRSVHHVPQAGAGVVVVQRRLALALMGAGALVLTWAAGSTWFVLSRDDIAQRVFIRETEMRYGYENRIGNLSDRLQREVTQNMVERTSVEARVAALAARQAEIEARQAWLRATAERASGIAGPVPTVNGPDADPWSPPQRITVPSGSTKPEPLPTAGGLGLRLRGEDSSAESAPKPEPRDRLSAVEQSLDKVARSEGEILHALGRTARTRLTRLRSAIDATGLDLPGTPASGGPLVALPADRLPGGHEPLAAALQFSVAEIARLQGTARTLPLGKPLAGEPDPTSGFGYRMDPFTRGPALHTGVDFRAEAGTPARATAAGRVVAAEYTGGYGNLVEIDHGNGVTTRYGHLSSFSVAPGETVGEGQIIGRTGSTGRSTGPHLHYETRVNGEAVNPVRFLQAGKLLGTRGG
ncbi:MAG: Peptidase [Enterovirga sp.]|nr:Peptidase [Enterovirga sp.]